MILDTNALSAFAEGHPDAVAAVNRSEAIALAVIVLGEYRYGIEQSHRKRSYDAWLTGFRSSCRVLPVTEETAAVYAVIRLELRRAGTPIPSNDLWIAALSRQHDLPVLSKDRHFDRVKGLRRVEW